MPTLKLPGVDLALAEQGAGRPVVLIHGFPMDHSIWAQQVESLAPHCRVITPDLRGAGRSSVTPGKTTVAQWADDLAAMLDALKIAEPIVLGGLSMGGYVAFRFFEAHRSRLAGLVLCDTKAAADTPQAAAGRLETALRLEREGCQFLADAMLPRLLALRPSIGSRAWSIVCGRLFLPAIRPVTRLRCGAWPSGRTSRRCCRGSIAPRS